MYLLDSSVAIEMMTEGKRLDIALSFIGDEEIAISPFTAHEILFGLSDEDESSKKFVNGINMINYDKACAEESATIDKYLTKSGNKIGIFDMFIASIAIANKMKLVTFDNDFSRVKGLDVKIL
ncbi:MAG: type II toxin-antitoxin system VapC family toxin [Candidatus Aenigmarchaeota archaeon]|nr:type II toxin-antitoxin system VapC family toxin [Candidatus Aenigmarchaeota archaeon]